MFSLFFFCIGASLHGTTPAFLAELIVPIPVRLIASLNCGQARRLPSLFLHMFIKCDLLHFSQPVCTCTIFSFPIPCMFWIKK